MKESLQSLGTPSIQTETENKLISKPTKLGDLGGD